MNVPQDLQKFEQEDTVVVYARDNGRIVHVHHFTTSSGGQHPDQQAREKAALEFASQRKNASSTNVGILHTKPSSFKENVAYHIDLTKHVLVEAQSK